MRVWRMLAHCNSDQGADKAACGEDNFGRTSMSLSG
jgi:hypothetical protein